MKKNNLKELRLKRGITKVKLAEDSDNSYCFICDLENGKNDIKQVAYDRLKRIANVLHCHIEDLFAK